MAETVAREYSTEEVAEWVAAEDTEACRCWDGEAGLVLVERECEEWGRGL